MTANGQPRLRSLDLQGYKTFASKSMFAFAPTITAIVGPNGSGKSNIADAIRWVLGEQSYSLLRGKRTDDMIFSGSEQRARASMASATITFDNSDGWLPIEFSEVTVGRRAYRDGTNEYLINGQRVRLRDVAELLARCGLGERTYTIIGQGLVDAALSLKAEERRRLFEEAAGIGLYRSRREETLRRLDQTQRNLDRVQDILAELRPRLRSLERQARRAQDYEQVRSELNTALRTWYGYHWFRLGDSVFHARREAEREAAQRDALREREEKADRDLATARASIDSLRAALHRNSQHVSAAYRERESLGRKLAVAEERLRWLGEQIGTLQAELGEADSSQALLHTRLDTARAELEQRRAALDEAQAQWEALTAPGGPAREGAAGSATLESLAGDRAAASARLEALEQQRRERQTELDRLVFEIQSSERALTEVTRQAEDLRSAVERAEAAKVRAARELEQARNHEEDIERRSAEASKEAAHHRTRLASLETRRALLEEVAQESAQVESKLVDGARQGRFRWKGRLSQALQVPEAYRPALAAALGPFAEAFGLPTANDVEGVLQAIAEGEESSTAALLRLDVEPSSPSLPPIDDPDFVGIASDLVQAPAEYRPALRALIGRTLVVRHRAAAMRILDRVRLDDVRVVTLHGELFLPGGHVLVGEGKAGSAARRVSLKSVEENLARAREAAAASDSRSASLETELRETRRQILALSEASNQAIAAAEQARSQQAEKNAASQAARQHLEFLHTRLETLGAENAELEERIGAEKLRKDEVDSAYARLELETKRADLSAGKESGAIHLAQAEAHLQLARSAVEEARGRLSEMQTTWAERDTSRQARAARRETLNAEQAQLRSEINSAGEQMKSIEARLASLAAEAAPAEKALGEAEEARAALEREESRLRSEVQAAERSHAQAQIELARREEELSSLQRRVEDDFGLVAFDFDETTATQAPLPFEGLVEHLARVEELSPDVEGQVNRLRLQLRRMGAINPEAQKEYLEVKERVEFLTTQLADLRKAEGQLQGVITELDELMQREFQRTFEAVTVEFKKAFTRLFGGGSARLTLTDPNDLTQTGIDIEARLPGRREQGLSMLSGGERSLTACALVFALLKVSPTPFCVLDEVDAMLDESNVTRFREMLHELSSETQFIVITHNRQTVQAADVIYGVSMGPDSASRVISLKLDEAQNEMAA